MLSFGYWTTNFAEVQRALSAKNMSAARRTPIIAAYPKVFIPALTIIPGLIALIEFPKLGAKTGDFQYNNAIPLLMDKYLPNGVLGIAVTGLLAAFMAGMAANVSSFNTVFTYDIWQDYIKKDRPDEYYLRVGRVVTVRGRLHRHRHGVHRRGLQQHHDLHPGAVLDLQRAAVRDLHHRHVLEADDLSGGLRRPDRRDPRRGVHLRHVRERCRQLRVRRAAAVHLRIGTVRQLLGRRRGLRCRRRGQRRRDADDGSRSPRKSSRAWSTGRRSTTARSIAGDKVWWRSPVLLGAGALALSAAFYIPFL